MICWKCHKEINIEGIFRSTECPLCHADLHCCKGCKFYAPGNHFDCRENVEAPVSDKENANFCDFFMAGNANSASDSKADAAKNAAALLFGEDVKTSSNTVDSAKKAFNSLFGD